jgi:opacity protein-like surface antigen
MKMKKLPIIVFLFLTTDAFALDPLGPPVATPKEDSPAILGFEYLYGEMDLHSDSFVFTTHPVPPALPDTINFSSANIKDFQSNKFYANLISDLGDDNFDFFLRVGIADANPGRSSNRGNFAGSLGDCDYDVALGGGLRTTLFQSADGRTKWGLLAQLSYLNFDYDDRFSTIDGYDVLLSATVKMLEIQFAAGPAYQLTDKLSIYGGPFVSLVKADADIEGTINGDAADGSTDIEQQSEFGGFIGLSTELAKNTNFNIEFQMTDDAQAVGFRFIHRF